MPPDEDVLDQQEETNERPAVPPKGAETVTIPKSEYERINRERDEFKNSERFWAERARASGRGDGNAPATPAEDEVEIETADLLPKPEKVTGAADVDESIYEDPDKWLAAIAKGPGAVKALVAKATAGMVTPEQAAEIAAKVARRTVQVERTKMTTDSKLMTTYPELENKESELYQETAKEFRKLINFDPSAENSPTALFAAAGIAKARLEGKKAKARPADDEDEDGYERVDVDRRRRVAAQDGSGTGRGAAVDDDDSNLGPQARSLIKGMGITDAEFLAERNKIKNGRRAR